MVGLGAFTRVLTPHSGLRGVSRPRRDRLPLFPRL